MRLRSRALCWLSLGALIAAGCRDGTHALGSGTSSARDVAEITEQVTRRVGEGRRLQLYESYDQVLPNVSYAIDDNQPITLTELVVVGSVVSATEGRPVARWRTVDLKVRVDEVLGTKGSAPDEIQVGFAIGGDVDPNVVVRGLRGLGRVVLPLTRSSPVFAYDPELYGIAEDGTLLARVLDSGELELPFKSDGGKELLGDHHTLAALRAQATAPHRELHFRTEGAVPTRIG